MAEGGGGETQNKALSAISNTLLLGAAGWGLQVAHEHPFAGAAFAIYFTKGLCGVAVLALDDDNAKTLLEHANNLAYHFGVPLIACEMTRVDCVPLIPTVVEYFLLPMVNFVGKQLEFDIDARMLALSHGYALGNTSACMHATQDSPGKLAFVNAFIASILTEGQVAEEVSTFLLAVACALTWATMTNKLPF